MASRPHPGRLSAAALGLCFALGLLAPGCATPLSGQGVRYSFFGEPVPERDPWHAKVERWQARERRDRPAEAHGDAEALLTAGPHTGLLRVKMQRWETSERLALAERIAAWAQVESRRHYRFDPVTDVAGDPWPTTKDLLDQNGDDCDGLDLITFKLMREFGFPRDELFRAIVKRVRDGANHMVTLWFEDPEDPWVVDATGAVSKKVRRFSELPGWRPTKLFNEQVQFTPVVRGGDGSEVAQAD